MNTNILVTGANGQLGRTIEELYSNNNEGLNFTFVTKKEFDITNEEQIKSFFTKSNFDYCINCAAYTNVEQAEKTSKIAYKVNAEGVKNLAIACNEFNTVLIHISTDYVFDGEKKTPYTIDDIPNPINEYGKSKLKGEEYIKNISSDYFVVRTSWLYSKKYGNNFYRTIVRKAEIDKEIFVTDEQTGCPTNTENLAKYIIYLIKKSIDYGIKHFSDNQVMTWYDFAEQVLSENDLKNTTNLVKTTKYVTFAKRPKYTVLKNEYN